MTSSVYNYVNNAKLWLPMTAVCHDPVNVRTLDKSVSKFNAQFGDGVTPAKYPTKLSERGYYLDGGDYLDCGDQAALNFTTTGTVVVFFKTTVNPSNFQCLVAKQNWTTGNNGYSIWLDYATPSIRVDIRNAVANNSVTSSITGGRGVAHFAALVWTGTLVKNYADGYILTTPQTLNPTYLGGIPFRIGASPQTATFNYSGQIYFVGAWDYALSELQLRDLEARLRRQLNDV